MRERLALRVPGEEPRNAHGAVVDVHALLVPRHAGDQRVEQLVGGRDEAGPQINPGAVGERPAFHLFAETGEAEVARGTKQRWLDHEGHTKKFSQRGEHTFARMDLSPNS